MAKKKVSRKNPAPPKNHLKAPRTRVESEPQQQMQATGAGPVNTPSVPASSQQQNAFTLLDDGSISPLSGLRPVSAGEKWRQHRLIADRHFYTLPIQLLQELEREFGVDRFAPELWEMEKELAQINEDHSFRVGFFNGDPLFYSFLRQNPLGQIAQADFMKPSDVSAVKKLSHRLDLVRRDLRAYAGWLVTNPEFIDEQQKVWNELVSSGMANAIPAPVDPRVIEELKRFGYQADESPMRQTATQNLHRFYSRWRLQQLVGPRLPLPLGRNMAQGFLAVPALQAEASGFGILVIPDTMPIPPETEIRLLMEDTIKSQPAAHLEKWQKIIGRSNPAKSELKRYARIFELQHFYRVFMSRHQIATTLSQADLEAVFASFLHVSEDTIKDDLRLIKKRLGRDWWAVAE